MLDRIYGGWLGKVIGVTYGAPVEGWTHVVRLVDLVGWALRRGQKGEGRASYTRFVRGRPFAAVAPATQTRADVGLRFKDPPESKFLVPSKGPGRATHKLSLTSPDQITPEVEALLRVAYEQNG